MWESVALQIPVVAIFVWFVLEKSKRDAEAAKERDAQWAEAAENRDAQWREFFVMQSNASLGALEKMSAATLLVADKLQSHDEAMRHAVVRMETVAKLRQELLMDSKPKAKAARAPRNL
jgi:hypothetical protein